MFDLRRMTKNFLLGETLDKPGLMSYIQSLEEIVYSIRPSSKSESRRLEIAKEQLRNIRRHSKRLAERVKTLEERITTLEENTEVQKEG